MRRKGSKFLRNVLHHLGHSIHGSSKFDHGILLGGEVVLQCDDGGGVLGGGFPNLLDGFIQRTITGGFYHGEMGDYGVGAPVVKAYVNTMEQ